MKNNWVPTKLKDVCKKITDGSHNPPKGIEYSDYLMLSSKNVFDDCINLDSPRYLSETDFNTENKRTDVQIGDVLLTIVGTIGRVAVVSSDFSKFTLQRSVAVLKTKDEFIDSRFLMRSLQNIFDEMTQKARGVAQKGLYLNQIKELEIPLPPLTEQQRIVAILDEAFAQIAQAKENAEKNLQNARELFDSYLQSVFANPGDGWEKKKLGSISTKIGSGATPRGGNESYKAEGISLIRSMNVHDRRFKEDKLAFIDDAQANALSNVVVQENDVLLNITGASVARCCVMPKEYLPARVNQHVSIIRPKKEMVDSTFLNLLLTSKFYKDQLLFTGEQGATRQAITKAQIQDFEVAFPSVEKQQAIINKLSALSAETQKLENIYRQKINDLDELKKSILQKAFSGELTAQNEVLNVIEFPVRIPNISATDLQAGIVATAFQRHQESGKVLTFGHVKAEKIVHLAQEILNIELEREPVKDAAGPNDFPRLLKVQSRAEKAGFFYTNKQGYGGYTYTEGSQFDNLIEKTKTALAEKADELTALIDLLVPMDTQQAELVATVYAAWNNLLIDNLTITDEAIVTEARENWHEAKLKIERDRFFKTISWMRENNLTPKGKGKKVLARSGK